MNYSIEAMKTRMAAVILVFLASACVIQKAAEPEGASDAAVAPSTKGELKANAKPDATASAKPDGKASAKPAGVAKAEAKPVAVAKVEAKPANAEAKPANAEAKPAKAAAPAIKFDRVARYVTVEIGRAHV